jgi:hypothetical protein
MRALNGVLPIVVSVGLILAVGSFNAIFGKRLQQGCDARFVPKADIDLFQPLSK